MRGNLYDSAINSWIWTFKKQNQNTLNFILRTFLAALLYVFLPIYHTLVSAEGGTSACVIVTANLNHTKQVFTTAEETHSQVTSNHSGILEIIYPHT